MTTFELKRSILQDINALMDDEAAMRRISRYIRRLRNSTSTKDVAHEDMIPYTMNELHERIDKVEKAIIEGNVIDSETEDAQLADFMRTL